MSTQEAVAVETTANDLAHRVMSECIGSCSLLSLLPEEQRLETLQGLAAENRVWCHGPEDRQKIGAICTLPVDTKNAMMQTIHAAKV